MENKTPEEIFDILLKVSELKIDIETAEKKIIEYGKQQYNQAVLDCIENAEISSYQRFAYGDIHYFVDKESMKKLLKQ